MSRKCVFCGLRPVIKTKEHIIPLWLIRHTGDENRTITINTRVVKEIKMSFDNLQFPACDECNNKFANLEGKAKKVLLRLLEEQPLTNACLNTLLMWFDKVRIGLWLGLTTLNKNFYGVTPKFHIANRINQTDRMLLIYKATYPRRGITFCGIDSPLFSHFPSFLGLSINQFFFINVSTDFLISRRLGLPYPEKMTSFQQGIKISLIEGRKYIMSPVMKGFHNKGCTEIYQPVPPTQLRAQDTIQELYNDDYTKAFLNIDTGIGKIFISVNKKGILYPDTDSTIWLPQIEFSTADEVNKLWNRDILFFQNWLIDNHLAKIEDKPADLKLHDQRLIKLTKLYIKRLETALEDLTFTPQEFR